MRVMFVVVLVALAAGGCGDVRRSEKARHDYINDAFPIMAWELPAEKAKMLADPRQGVAGMAECGFTVAGFVTPQDLPACERAGIRAIVADRGPMVKWRELSDDQIVKTVKRLIDGCGGSPAVAGYFLTDEPGVGDFPALAKAVAAVKALAPGKLAYINLFPNYATLGAPDLSQLGTASYSEYLERFVTEVKPQVISYDNYLIQYSDDMADAGKASGYFTNLIEVRRVALEHQLPFWHIVSANQIRPHTVVPSPANLLLQAYTTLAAGGKGLTWYTYYVGGYHYAGVDKGGGRTMTWSYLKMVNEQVKALGPLMSRLRSTGVYFTTPPPAPAPSLPSLPGELVETMTADGPAMIGEFSGTGPASGERYAMLVNLNLQRSVKFTLRFRGGAVENVRLVSPVDGSLAPLGEDDDTLWLAAGQGALLRVR